VGKATKPSRALKPSATIVAFTVGSGGKSHQALAGIETGFALTRPLERPGEDVGKVTKPSRALKQLPYGHWSVDQSFRRVGKVTKPSRALKR